MSCKPINKSHSCSLGQFYTAGRSGYPRKPRYHEFGENSNQIALSGDCTDHCGLTCVSETFTVWSVCSEDETVPQLMNSCDPLVTLTLSIIRSPNAQTFRLGFEYPGCRFGFLESQWHLISFVQAFFGRLRSSVYAPKR